MRFPVDVTSSLYRTFADLFSDNKPCHLVTLRCCEGSTLDDSHIVLHKFLERECGCADAGQRRCKKSASTAVHWGNRDEGADIYLQTNRHEMVIV